MGVAILIGRGYSPLDIWRLSNADGGWGETGVAYNIIDIWVGGVLRHFDIVRLSF